MLPETIPFSQEEELYNKLIVSNNHLTRSHSSKNDTLPGHPRVSLNDLQLGAFLTKELTTPDLNTFRPYLWLVTTQSSSHITALSSQAVRGRDIILSEDPSLHIVWIHSRIYIKPIPKYLLSHSFWAFHFADKFSPLRDDDKLEVGNAARGFLRSYAHLIRHKSDFRLAQKHDLIPKNVRYSKFINFISCFEQLQDSDVSPRYSFGELRLSRLNFWAVFAIGRLDFHKIVWQYGAYLSQFYGPLLFIFGGFAVILGAMQVALAVQSLNPPAGNSSNVFANVCKGFSVMTLYVVLIAILCLFLMCVIRWLRELKFAVAAKCRKKAAVTKNAA
jgi:hypothetical protein